MEGEEVKRSKTWYIGETSRSPYERIKEHMWLFTNKKKGDPEKEYASSALWRHSKEAHGGQMREGDWRLKITSTHKSPLHH